MNTTRTVILSLLGVVLIVVAIYFYQKGNAPVTNNNNEQEVMCTADAFQCPDGTWVGRTGPNCQFECPTPSTETATVETMIDQGASALDVKIVPLAVIEDSRCPKDVQCIQAGTVRVRAQLISGLGTANQIFTLNAPVTTEAETITLVEVRPETEAGKSINAKDYRFVFKISKR